MGPSVVVSVCLFLFSISFVCSVKSSVVSELRGVFVSPQSGRLWSDGCSVGMIFVCVLCVVLILEFRYYSVITVIIVRARLLHVYALSDLNGSCVA